jgi:hypothetical protein
MTIREMEAVVRELKMMLESLCAQELTENGRRFVRARIRNYEDRISQAKATGHRDK